MKNILLKLFSIAFFMTAGLRMQAQVTTSSMSGRLTDNAKQPVAGAYVIATHEPSGTQYSAAADNSGYYSIQNMRIGGPYKTETKMIGFKDAVHTDIILKLGENFVLDIELTDAEMTLDAAVVTAIMRNDIINSDRTGAQTNISSRQINTMPTVTRSITDFTRLTPQANGMSFAGRDGRFNTISIDGAAFNNNFGLSSNPMPGGNAQPVSLDAIEEISVNIAPFDVRLSQFTGAGINAVTKSGDNHIKGAAYTYIRPKSFTGSKIGDITVPGANERNSQVYGFRVGGPILKNKLFYFVSGEIEQETLPSNAWEPSTDGNEDLDNKISRTTVADLQKVSDHLKSRYGYDAGKFQNFDNFKNKNYKILARIDWNINENHKLALRYNEVVSTSDQLTNTNSAPSGLLRGSNRISDKAISFGNAFYGFENTVRSITGELNSSFSPKISNKLLISYTHVQDTRTSNSALFPFVDIWSGGDQYMSFGYELFTYGNDVVNNTLTFTNNLTVSLNKHTITAGVSFDRMYFKNAYMREGTSYYRYNSLDDFINNEKPVAFGITYGYQGNDEPAVELAFGMGSVYIQDEWQADPKFKLTYGIRFEVPFYFNELQNNPIISNYIFNSWDSNAYYRMNVGSWPKSKPSFSPRLGFNWDVKGDRSVQVRGGTGLFSGLLPFVWFTNQPNGSGMIQSPEVTLGAGVDVPDDMRFNPNWKEQIKNYPDLFPDIPGAFPRGSSTAEVDKNFKLPQVWRSNLAIDVKIPWNMIFTLEGIYSKDINAVMQKNINLPYPDRNLNGPDTRPYWSANRISSDIGTAMLLTNTDKGHQYSLTAQLTKNYSKGFSGSLAYTFSMAKDITTNPGSTAASAWQSNTDVSYLNDPALGFSGFAVPHRVVASLSYRIEYLRHLATTVSIYYQGSSIGRFSYTYTNDINNDGNGSDLMYIPKSKDELKFADFTDSRDNTITAAQQADAFWNYVQNDSYLSKHKGEYAQRYAFTGPWRNRFDIKLLQDVFADFGSSRRYTLQIGLDIINAGNLLNKKWGATQFHGLSSYDNIRPLTRVRFDDYEPVYRLNVNNADIKEFQDKSKFVNNPITSSTWGMLLGIRLIF